MTDVLEGLGISPDLKSYMCTHVFARERPILYVARPEGDWCFLCGEDHPDDASAIRVVGLGHALDFDASVAEVLDLGANEEAERLVVDGAWTRSSF